MYCDVVGYGFEGMEGDVLIMDSGLVICCVNVNCVLLLSLSC